MLVVCGAIVALTLFRLCGDRRRLLLRQTWSAALLDALGVEVEADLSNQTPAFVIIGLADKAVGEVGEITLRSPGNFKGYWNKPEATAKALQDGWEFFCSSQAKGTPNIEAMKQLGYVFEEVPSTLMNTVKVADDSLMLNWLRRKDYKDTLRKIYSYLTAKNAPRWELVPR